MRILLDTNVIIHRETHRVVKKDIGILFRWLDHLKYEKCIHPLSIDEIKKYGDPQIVASFEAKMASYQLLKTTAPDSPEIQAIRARYDVKPNDSNDTTLLNELFNDRVDLLVTEDRKMQLKADELGIGGRVFTIDAFLEKVVAENPNLVDYKVLAVRQELFGNIDLQNDFFASFKEDYSGFEKWFNKKADELAYVCQRKDEVLAFLYIKRESKDENYRDITPVFEPKLRLKIGTFKVAENGFKLGERFLKIVFDNALQFKVDEVYVTIFDRTEDQKRLIKLLEDWGFYFYGVKQTASGEEKVFVRDFTPKVNILDPRLTYPYFSSQTKKFIVPIQPEYHTELFPDSYLRTESPLDFVENQPNRNAISKVYISRSWNRNLNIGDVIVFYRTSPNGYSKFKSITTTVGVIQKVSLNIRTENQFIELCRKRSVFTDQELSEWWNEKPNSRPFVVNFLYICSFSNKLTLDELKNLNIISKPPRGFEQISDSAFHTLMEQSNGNMRLIVD